MKHTSCGQQNSIKNRKLYLFWPVFTAMWFWTRIYTLTFYVSNYPWFLIPWSRHVNKTITSSCTALFQLEDCLLFVFHRDFRYLKIAMCSRQNTTLEFRNVISTKLFSWPFLKRLSSFFCWYLVTLKPNYHAMIITSYLNFNSRGLARSGLCERLCGFFFSLCIFRFRRRPSIIGSGVNDGLEIFLKIIRQVRLSGERGHQGYEVVHLRRWVYWPRLFFIDLTRIFDIAEFFFTFKRFATKLRVKE